jgi:hypothetical protein
MACVRNEEELILLCARTSVNDQASERINELIGQGVDWGSIVRTASWHKVIPLLYRSLINAAAYVLPETIREQLYKYYLSNLGRNVFLAKQLLRIVDLLNAQGIATIPFKGLALASSVYGDLGLRQFNDLDLLLHKEDVFRAMDLLRAHGFHPRYPLTRDQETCLLNSNYHYEFRRHDLKVIVEIHWALAPSYSPFVIDVDRAWDASNPILLQGKSLLSIAPEDFLLTLCEHGARHCWGRLSWICDVAELINSCKHMDWPVVLQRAEELGGRRMLSLGLCLARQFFQTSLPQYVMEWTQADRLAVSLASQVRKQIFQGEAAQNGISEDRIFLFYLKTMIRPEDRVKSYLKKIMLPWPVDVTPIPPSPFLFPLYYLIRPVRLIVKYEKILLKRLLQGGAISS